MLLISIYIRTYSMIIIILFQKYYIYYIYNSSMVKSFDVLFRDNFHILMGKLKLFTDISKTFVYKNIQLNMYLQ